MSFWNHAALGGSLRRALLVPIGLDDSERDIAVTQAVTWIATSVRQLANAGRLSGEFQRRSWPVELHWPLNGARISVAEGGRYAEFYELSASRASSLTTMRLCGMLVHSLVLAPVIDSEGAPAAVRFNTMLTRDEGLFRLEWSDLARLVERTCDEIAGSGVIHGL